MAERNEAVEWPTLALLGGCSGVWALAITLLAAQALPLGIAVAAVAAALHASLTHEVIHGHPTRSGWLNATLVFPALSLVVPYLRFRDTHLAHHRDSVLTDPFDDPESNYLDAAVWARLPRALRWLYAANNTLAGRMAIGPALGMASFAADEWRRARAGDAGVARGWLWHLPAAALVLGVVAMAPMPIWAYLLAAYAAMSILKIRTFLEHRAHETARARTVIVEDRGPLALMFLNNNFHVVHHMHPRLPWYRLPQVYFGNRTRYLGINGGYMYRSYGAVFRSHLWRAKDPVAHPLWRRG